MGAVVALLLSITVPSSEALERARHAGCEQSPLVPFGKRLQSVKGFGIGQTGPGEVVSDPAGLEVLLTDVDGGERIVVDP